MRPFLLFARPLAVSLVTRVSLHFSQDWYFVKPHAGYDICYTELRVRPASCGRRGLVTAAADTQVR